MFRQQSREETMPTTPLYDAEAVRQVLARASEIEAQRQAEPDTLTPGQVEALGTELGLSPAAVLRALGERETQTVPVAATVRVVVVPAKRRLRVAEMLETPLPGLSFAVLVALLFFVLNPFLPSFHAYGQALLIGLVFVVPSLLSGWLGWKRGDGRLGAATGFFLSGLALLAPMVGIGLQSGRWDGYGSSLSAILWLCVLAGTVFGWFGAWLRERHEQEQAERAR